MARDEEDGYFHCPAAACDSSYTDCSAMRKHIDGHRLPSPDDSGDNLDAGYDSQSFSPPSPIYAPDVDADIAATVFSPPVMASAPSASPDGGERGLPGSSGDSSLGCDGGQTAGRPSSAVFSSSTPHLPSSALKRSRHFSSSKKPGRNVTFSDGVQEDSSSSDPPPLTFPPLTQRPRAPVVGIASRLSSVKSSTSKGKGRAVMDVFSAAPSSRALGSSQCVARALLDDDCDDVVDDLDTGLDAPDSGDDSSRNGDEDVDVGPGCVIEDDCVDVGFDDVVTRGAFFDGIDDGDDGDHSESSCESNGAGGTDDESVSGMADLVTDPAPSEPLRSPSYSLEPVDGAQLIWDTPLQGSGLVINSVLGVVICPAHSVGVSSNGIMAHLKSHHRHVVPGRRKSLKTWSTTDKDIEQAVSMYALVTSADFVSPPVDSLPFDGLPVHPGRFCTVASCSFVSSSQDAISLHFKRNHQGLRWSDYTRTCSVQVVFPGGRHAKSIRVVDVGRDRRSSPSTSLVVNQLLAKYGPDSHHPALDGLVPGIDTHRDVSAMLNSLHWLTPIEGLDAKSLESLAALPDVDKEKYFSPLSGIAKEYLATIEGYVRHAPLTCRRLLKSHDESVSFTLFYYLPFFFSYVSLAVLTFMLWRSLLMKLVAVEP